MRSFKWSLLVGLVLFTATAIAQTGQVNLGHRHNQVRISWNNVPNRADGSVRASTLNPRYSTFNAQVVTITATNGYIEVGGGEGYGVRNFQQQPASNNKFINGNEAISFTLNDVNIYATQFNFRARGRANGAVTGVAEYKRNGVVFGTDTFTKPVGVNFQQVTLSLPAGINEVAFKTISGMGYSVSNGSMQVVYAPVYHVAGCALGLGDFPADFGGTITGWAPPSFDVFSDVSALVVGPRADGRPGVWEVHYDCTVHPLRGGFGPSGYSTPKNSSVLPQVRRMELSKGWEYTVDGISADGKYAYGCATNPNGYTDRRVPNKPVQPGTVIPVVWKFSFPFYGRVGTCIGQVVGTPEYGFWGSTKRLIVDVDPNIGCIDTVYADNFGWYYACNSAGDCLPIEQGPITIGNCTFTNLPADLLRIVDIQPVTFKSFDKVDYLIAGEMTNGRPGAWEVDLDNCAINPLRGGTEFPNNAHSGLKYNQGWTWHVTGIAPDGSKVYLDAVNQNGFTPTGGACLAAGVPPVPAGTVVPISFDFDVAGNPFYGRIMFRKLGYECNVVRYNCSNGYITGCDASIRPTTMFDNSVNQVVSNPGTLRNPNGSTLVGGGNNVTGTTGGLPDRGSTSVDTVGKTDVTAVEESLVEEVQVDIVPNPTTGNIRLVATGNLAVNVLIYNVSGQQVAMFEQVSNGQLINLDLQPGLYLVRTINGQTHDKVMKLIVE